MRHHSGGNMTRSSRRSWMSHAAMYASLILAHVFTASGIAENVVDGSPSSKVESAIVLTMDDARRVVDQFPDFAGAAVRLHDDRVRRKLETHIEQLLEEFPYQVFQHTLGISGYEQYFNHPDELFYSLSLALPFLSEPVAGRTKRLMTRQLKASPPYAIRGYANRAGSVRCSYGIPDELLREGRGEARDVFGVYAFWVYCHVVNDSGAAKEHWPAIQQRMSDLLGEPYAFDIYAKGLNDEPETLNRDLAGMVGYLRLADHLNDTSARRAAEARFRELLELRVNLERVNAQVVTPTRETTSHLHAFKLARYVGLVPSVARAVREHVPSAAGRIATLRSDRETWYMAYGDRLIGGENYTNPPHFSRALFSAATFIETPEPDQLDRWVDVPWCRGDFYFIEKSSFALWAAGGGMWTDLMQRKTE